MTGFPKHVSKEDLPWEIKALTILCSFKRHTKDMCNVLNCYNEILLAYSAINLPYTKHSVPGGHW